MQFPATTPPVKKASVALRRVRQTRKFKIIFPLNMARAQRRPFKIVPRPAGERAQKAPPSGELASSKARCLRGSVLPGKLARRFSLWVKLQKLISMEKIFWFPSGPAHFLFLRHTATPPATAAAMTTTGHAPARKTASCCTPCAKFCQPLANASAMRETKLSLGGE